ncbi:MAG: pyridoxal phosphate-dependent aminotransferase [Bacteroidales bacterium]|nr:pyridoxal phosphate-dependent aminotransferase [Bacteroidales bacterium]MBR3414039.1 pyridoxal phosphate-dependent aminotransferase [Bacteroidales bacterium]
MVYNFDEFVERKGTDCVKHDALKQFFGRDDLLPMWVADMDFRSPDFVMEALRHRCEHEVLGYAIPSEGYWNAVDGWLQKHYHIAAEREELHFIPGIVSGIAFVIMAMTNPGDGIMVTTPVYPPFLNLPQNNHRQLVRSPLKIDEGRFVIDFDDMEWRARQCQWLILSNPHNPGGTVWDEETLRRVADICYRNNVSVISDEIHADMTLPGHRHVSFSTVNSNARNISITFIAPSKTFNIAGLGSSVCYCPNERLRQRFFGYLDSYEVANGNIFAYVGAEAAYSRGEEWLHQMLQYLQGNVECLRRFLDERLPKVKAILPEASYLAWLDFSAMGLEHEAIKERFINQAHIALNDGTTFGGKDYRCCFRINLGCPQAILVDALERIAQCF